MSISAVNKFYLNTPQINQLNNNKEKENKEISQKTDKQELQKGTISTKRAAGYIAAAAVGAAAIGGILAYKGRRFRFRRLEELVSELTTENQKAELNLKTYQKGVEDLIDGASSSSEVKERILTKFRQKISGALNYDPMQPPVVTAGKSFLSPDAIPLPARHIPTSNRINMREISIPEFTAGERFKIELPMSNEVHIKKEATGNFRPQVIETPITETYSDSVVWDNDKVARDIMQNFYDGHGQTLDGVRMYFDPLENGRYKVRIEGNSTYTPDKAILIGESSKQNDAKAAGNFGEGLKMTALKILKDSGADNFKVGSDNWNVTWKFMKGNLNDKRVLGLTLDKVDRFDGNYIEFETNNKTLLRSLRNTINRFYHSGNTDFKCPDIENSLIGIKILPEDKKGALYIAGQRYQVSNSYEGLKGMTIFLKEKPPAKIGERIIFDPSRDRTSLNSEHLKSIASYIAEDKSIPNNELVRIIHSLENFWDAVQQFNPNEKGFLEGLIKGAQTRDLQIKFPDKYVARTFYDSPEMLQSLHESGYIICNKEFNNIGMQRVDDLLDVIRKHKPLAPTDVEKQKIILLKEGIKTFTPYLEGKYFSPEELDTKIFIFNKDLSGESRYYGDTMAEAITQISETGNRKSLGFWVDRTYLEKESFSNAMGTTLHELCHKFGGDESSTFSYRLTDIMQEMLASTMNDPKGRTELQQLQKLWDELPKNCN